MPELTIDEAKLIGFAVACYLEDLDKEIKKESRKRDMKLAIEQRNRVEQIAYTKLIPESWCGPKPSYWK